MKSLILVLFAITLLTASHPSEVRADDPYCERRFNGQIIIVNPLGASVYQSPDSKSDIILNIDFGEIVEGCLWDTNPDTINNYPGWWRKIRHGEIIGYVFSTDGFYLYPKRFAEEKIIRLIGGSSISFSLFNRFYGIFETANGDSLLECKIRIKRYTVEEINGLNQLGRYDPVTPRYSYIETDKPYECKLLISTKEVFSPKRINIEPRTMSLNATDSINELKFKNCELAKFQTKCREFITNGYEGSKCLLLIQAGEHSTTDTLYSCLTPYFCSLTFDFFGDINNDNIVDFLIHHQGEGPYRHLYVSQGKNMGYRMIHDL
jgi:hypothetical protein